MVHSAPSGQKHHRVGPKTDFRGNGGAVIRIARIGRMMPGFARRRRPAFHWDANRQGHWPRRSSGSDRLGWDSIKAHFSWTRTTYKAGFLDTPASRRLS